MPTNNPLDLSDPQATDTSGNEAMSLGTRLAGEDIPNDVQKVENRFSATFGATATTTVIKTGAGLLHRIVIAGGTLGTIVIYDNTAASGTVIASFGASAAIGSYEFNCAFATGLTIVTAAATNVTTVWR